MADEKLTAATRIEKLLDNIAGGDNDVTPATRLEKFLSYIADAMEGGGGSGGGGGDLPVYEIKSVPSSVGLGNYIDGDPAEITSGPCVLVKDGVVRLLPVYMYAEDGYYTLITIVDAGVNKEAITDVYNTNIFDDPDYVDKLCVNLETSGG